MSYGPWRKPAEKSIDPYLGLVLCDNRVSGSITVSRSRLPLWAFAHTAITRGWQEVDDGWEPTARYGFTERDFGDFLNNLLAQRREFGRLLLVLADAESRGR